MFEPKRLVLPTLPRREEEAQIRQAYKEARDGGVRVVFIGGQSGTGKSFLVERAVSSTPPPGTKITWHSRSKFDQRMSNAPLTNLRYIFSELFESTRSVLVCGTLKNQLEPNQYQVLKSFLMDGDISDSEDSDAEESKWDDNSEEFLDSNNAATQKDALSVLASTLKATLRIMSNLATIVLTVDDIHWCCDVTAHILKSLLTDPSLKNVLFCTTFRTNETTARGGFYEWKDKLEKEIQTVPNAGFVSIGLDNLSQSQIQELLAEAVSREVDDVRELAETVFGFTHGNLFFTKHFLDKLQDDELLTFDLHQFKWQWDCAMIKRRSSLADNVVQQLASRMKKLPQSTQNVLMLAACFGSQFDVRALEVAKAALKVVCIHQCIEIAHQQEFIIQLSKTHYKFAHDMIQLAAYGLLPEDLELPTLHWKIGSLLVKEDELMKDDAVFFATVDHLNLGADANIDSCSLETKCLLAKVNYKAGCKASKLSSFFPASTYLAAGIEALGDKPFEMNYDLALKLFVLQASTEYVKGDIDASLEACQQVYDNGRTCQDKIQVVGTMFGCYTAKNDPQVLLDYCFHKLELLGIKLPRKPNSVYVQLEFQKMKRVLKSMSDEDILALPLIDDFGQELTLDVLSRLMYPLYHREEVALCTLVACRMITITLKHGWSKRSSGSGFVHAATFIIGQTHDIREGYRLGNLAVQMTRKYGLTGENALVVTSAASATKWWLEPVQNGLEGFLEAYRVAMKAGQVGTAFVATIAYSVNYFYAGLPLAPLLEDVEKYANQYLEYNQTSMYFLGSPLLQLLLCLTGKEENPANMYEGRVSARRNAIDKNQLSGEQTMKANQMLLSFYLGDLPMATKMADELSTVSAGMMKPSFWYTSRRFIMALVAIANYRLTKNSKSWATAEKHLKFFRTVVKEGAINLVHKLQLLEAEHATISTSSFRSQDLDSIFAKYDEAVVSASRSGFLQDAALANYLTFQFCKDKPNRAHVAELYLKRSFELWMSWGAVAVAESLVNRHEDMFNSVSVRNSISSLKDSTSTRSSGTGGGLRGRARFDAQLSLQHKELNVN